MAIPVLILGDSGSGKTASLREMNPETTLVIQPVGKRLPFKSKGWDKSIVVTDNYAKIHKCVVAAGQRGKTAVIIDDANYLMMNEMMRRSSETGFQKYMDLAKNFWELIDHIQRTPGDTRFYFMMHTQTDADGKSRPKTVGKMLDEKIVIEGLFTTVLACKSMDGRHFFQTKTNGDDCVKTPIGMFDSGEIENNLSNVDKTICEYEDIK